MDRYKTISKQEIDSLLRKNEEDRVYTEQIRRERDTNYNPYPNGWNRHDFYREVFSDMYVEGFIEEYPHGRVVRQAQRSYYYRGESQIFKSSQSSLYRSISNTTNEEEVLMKEFIADMRIADFLDLLLQFNHTQEFISWSFTCNGKPVGGIDLLYEQIAQHYGLETRWLDITSDFEVALFFACCKYDMISKRWEPLSERDFNEKDETQYGVIFRRSATDPANFFPDELQKVVILPVGFQPFMRCAMQSAYIAMMDKSCCLQDDNMFEIFQFKHDESLCKMIFERMDHGKKIYPHEGLALMEPEINDIRSRKVFSQATFDYVCENDIYKSYDKSLLKLLLSNYGYKLVNNDNTFSGVKIASINELYKDFDIESTYGIKLRTRLTYTPPNPSESSVYPSYW
jgi:hypothetical protein